MYRLICQKPAHFLSAQMTLVSTFFQMFIVFWMYNFDSIVEGNYTYIYGKVGYGVYNSGYQIS